MNIFTLSPAVLIGLFSCLIFVFVITYKISRFPDLKINLANALLMTLLFMVSLEALYVTIQIIPPEEVIRAGGEAAKVEDWITARGVDQLDLYIAWMAVLILCVLNFLLKARFQSPQQRKNVFHYDHFGLSIGIAALITSLLYIYLFIPAYFEMQVTAMEKLLFRGAIPIAISALFVWVILNVLFLFVRIFSQRSQDKNYEAELSKGIKKNPAAGSVLSRRIAECMALDKKSEANFSDFNTLIDMQSQTEKEEISITTSYLHTAMWAMPVLGFLGTVWGIAEAVANLVPLLQEMEAADFGGDQLSGALSGLGVAFDTTLVALLLSIPAMALISLLEKTAYEGVLIRNRIILDRLLKV